MTVRLFWALLFIFPTIQMAAAEAPMEVTGVELRDPEAMKNKLAELIVQIERHQELQVTPDYTEEMEDEYEKLSRKALALAIELAKMPWAQVESSRHLKLKPNFYSKKLLRERTSWTRAGANPDAEVESESIEEPKEEVSVLTRLENETSTENESCEINTSENEAVDEVSQRDEAREMAETLDKVRKNPGGVIEELERMGIHPKKARALVIKILDTCFNCEIEDLLRFIPSERPKSIQEVLEEAHRVLDHYTANGWGLASEVEGLQDPWYKELYPNGQSGYADRNIERSGFDGFLQDYIREGTDHLRALLEEQKPEAFNRPNFLHRHEMLLQDRMLPTTH